MLTIGQLADHAGVTVRAVRHYHAKGLLPEPARDASGYRCYDAAAVVKLVKIRTLAEAGVPLVRIHELLDADNEEFAAAVAEIDRRLRDEIRERQEHRRRLARLTAGDSLVLPPEVVEYLDLLRGVGAPEERVVPERDMWILMAARWPERIPEIIADKKRQLEDPKVVAFYRLIAQIPSAWDSYGDSPETERLLNRVADALSELMQEAFDSGELAATRLNDPAYTAVMDSFVAEAHPAAARLQDLLAERGWAGWTDMQKQG